MARTGIELLPHACRIVEVASRARLFGGGAPEPPRVTAFREIPYSGGDPDALTAELRQALKGIGRRASVAVWGLRSTHQAFLLPPAAPADLEAVARREARTAPGGLPAPPLADAVVAGALRGGRRQTGYAAVAADELRARIQPLLDAGVRVESVTTPALAHALLASQRRAQLPDAVVAVLSVNAQSTAITVVHGGVVLFARELPWGDQTDAPAEGRDPAGRAAFATRIAAELRRSLVYLRQSQNTDVSRVFVCGDFADLRSLTGPLVNELALDVETLDVGDDLDLSRLPEPSDSLRSRLGAWRTALALAVDDDAAARVAQPGPTVRRPPVYARPAHCRRRGGRCPRHGGGLGRPRLSLVGRDGAAGTSEADHRRARTGTAATQRRSAPRGGRHRPGGRAGRLHVAGPASRQGHRSAQPGGASRGRDRLVARGPSGGLLAPRHRRPGRRDRRRRRARRVQPFPESARGLAALGRPASPPSLRARSSDPAGVPGETVEAPRPPSLRRLSRPSRPRAPRPPARRTSRWRATAASIASPCGGSRATSRPAGERRTTGGWPTRRSRARPAQRSRRPA